MAEATIAGRKSIAVELNKDEKYYWCACGMSKNQPFCDGSHRGTGFTPVHFVAEESRTAYLCLCKRTGNAPFCDGSHKELT